MEVLAGREPAARLEERQHLLARRARVGRRLEDDEMARTQPRCDLPVAAIEDAQVGLALARERRGEGDEDRVRVAELVVVGRRRDEALVDERLQDVRGDVLDVALARVELGDASWIDVDEQDALARVGEGACERHADVAGAHDGDVALHRLGIVAASTCAIRSEAWPSP